LAQALEAPEQRLKSSVLPEAFNALDREGWSVLDLGPATTSSVGFYAAYPCRVGFADAFDGLADMARQWPMDPTVVWYDLRQLIPVDPERPWRLVLLWDLLDYVPGGLLEPFMDRLRHGLAPGARLHGFVTTGSQSVPERPPIYQILARDSVDRWIDPGSSHRSPPRYSPWHLQRHMPGLVQESSRQRREARQEHLLRLEG